MTTGRAEIQQVLDYAEKLKYFHVVAEKLRDVTDLDQALEESNARLASAKAREEQFARDAKAQRDAEFNRHQADMQTVAGEAQRKLAEVQVGHEEASRLYQAQTARDISDRTARLGALSHQIEVANAMLLGVETETTEAKQALAALNAETAAVEARLKAAKDAVAALLA